MPDSHIPPSHIHKHLPEFCFGYKRTHVWERIETRYVLDMDEETRTNLHDYRWDPTRRRIDLWGKSDETGTRTHLTSVSVPTPCQPHLRTLAWMAFPYPWSTPTLTCRYENVLNERGLEDPWSDEETERPWLEPDRSVPETAFGYTSDARWILYEDRYYGLELEPRLANDPLEFNVDETKGTIDFFVRKGWRGKRYLLSVAIPDPFRRVRRSVSLDAKPSKSRDHRRTRNAWVYELDTFS